MTHDDFVSAARLGSGRFRLDNVTITAGEQQGAGNGFIDVDPSKFTLFVTLQNPASVPDFKTGIFEAKDFWHIRGNIDDVLKFLVRAVPCGSSSKSGFGTEDRSTLKFTCERIEFEPVGLDRLTSEETSAVLEELREKFDPAEGSVHEPKPARPLPPPQARLKAVLPNFKLVDKNGGTVFSERNDFLGEDGHSSLDTFFGCIAGWTFGLIQRDQDLHVYLRSASEEPKRDQQHDWQQFSSFLDTLAFVHGQHAWPFTVEHRCGTQLLLARVQINAAVHRIPHAPFCETLAYNAKVKNLPWSLQTSMNAIFTFFNSAKPNVDEVRHVMYLLREACADGVPSRIRLLSLCSLLESLVRNVYAAAIGQTACVETKTFADTVETLCAPLRKGNLTEQRIASILKGMEPVNMRMRFEAVLQHLGIQWPAEWEPLFTLWSRFRNPLSHRISATDSSEGVRESLLAESRLAGGINCVLLKVMDYSGPVRLSAVEGRYTTL